MILPPQPKNRRHSRQVAAHGAIHYGRTPPRNVITQPRPEVDMAITLTDVRFLGDKADITVIFLYLGT